MSEGQRPSVRIFRKRWLAGAFVALWAAVGTWHTLKPMPPGTDVHTGPSWVAPAQVQFLYDLTSATPDGRSVHSQEIFDEILRIIDAAQTFIVADFFLVNDQMGVAGRAHRRLSRELADHLIARKQANPALQVLFITDPVNEVYAGAPSALLQELRRAGIEVVITDLQRLRDSNPLYSSLWRIFLQWWGNTAQGGQLANPFTSEPTAPVTLRSWAALLNFKANHRKLIVADTPDASLAALITSANPHDASSAHSNVALRLTGELAHDIVASEMAVARFSGWRGHIYVSSPERPAATTRDAPLALSLLTEASIRSHLLQAIDNTRNGDTIRIAMFYLADRKVVRALLDAAARNVTVRLILDPNRDAFGRQKDGVPNRPVANELVTRSQQRIEVRWYRTHGEQFHTKLAMVTTGDRFIASLGSANFTRRNLGNYNLETNIAVETAATAALARQMTAYFDRLWRNEGPPGSEYTAAFPAYHDPDPAHYWRYRLMEASGLSTF